MRPLLHHLALFVIFLATFVGIVATRKALPPAAAFVLVVASFVTVVWQFMYLLAIFRTDVHNVRPFPTEPVIAHRLLATSKDNRDEPRPYDWANEQAA